MYIEPTHWIFTEYSAVFKHYTPAIFVQEQMLDQITDRTAWHRTCVDWALNHYKPSSVGKMLDYYRQRVAEAVKNQVGAYDGEEVNPDCLNCHDLKTVWAKRQGAEFDWDMEERPCPKCAGVAV